jgi:hypothetical protein
MEVWTIIFAAIIASLGTARLTRLTAEDDWPPVARARNWAIERWNDSEWIELAVCPFCQAMYHAAFTVFFGYITHMHAVWWMFYGWLSLAYIAGMIVARDIPDAE